MKTSAGSLRSIASSSSRPSSSSAARTFATAARHAEQRPAPGAAMFGESAEEAFKRNLREVQSFRRTRDSLKIKTPFIPASVQPKATRPSALSTLLATGAALGCSQKKLNPYFAQFVYGNRAGLSIIDLDQTLPILRRTAALVRDVVKEDGVILFVGTRPGMQRCLEKAKERLGDNGFTTQRWLPGLLTNTETLFGLEPLLNQSYLPDLVVFLNPSQAGQAVRECTSRNIPTIGIVDSDTDPRFVTYPIPANTQSLRTAELICGTLSMAGQEGLRMRLREAETQKRTPRVGDS